MGSQRIINLDELVYIQLNATLLGVISTNEEKINIFFWIGALIECRCQQVDGEWTPIFIIYQTLSPNYLQQLQGMLPENMYRKLTQLVEEYCQIREL